MLHSVYTSAFKPSADWKKCSSGSGGYL